jgi:hypothetical protein
MVADKAGTRKKNRKKAIFSLGVSVPSSARRSDAAYQ